MPRRSLADLSALSALAVQQHRCVTLAQLAELRVPTSTIAHRCRPVGGQWTRVLPGVVLLHRGTPTPDERAAATLLYAGEDSVLTGLEALRRHGLRRLPVEGGAVHTLIPMGRRRVSVGIALCERTHRLPERDEGTLLPCASVARSLVDAARRMRRLDDVRAMTAEAVQRRLCRQEPLLEEVRLAQRRGTARVRLVAAEIVGGIRSVAEAEARVLFSRAGLPPALWNHDVLTPAGELVGCPDAWFDEAAVAVEVDSREFHLDPSGWERTQAKRARFASFGVLTVPVTPAALRTRPQTVLTDLWRALRTAQDRPRPDVLAVMRSQAA